MRNWSQEVRARLAAISVSPVRETEIIEELALHLRDRYDELKARGESDPAAENQVIAELEEGQLADELRRIERAYSVPLALGEGSASSMLSSFAQDIRYGIRVLRKAPMFTLVCLVSLSLGIGANTAIFQLIDAVRIRALPVQDPQQLAIVKVADRKWASGRTSGRYPDLSMPMWREIQAKQEGFGSIAAWASNGFNLATGGQAHYARGLWVSGDFFRVLGVQALMGRVLTPSDDVKGCSTSGAVISYSFWQRELGGDRAVIGRKLSLDGHPFEIVGVTAAAFYGIEVGRSYDVAVPLCSEPIFRGEDSMMEMRHGWWLGAIGRLKPGWTLQKATAQLTAISPAIIESTLPTVYDADGVKHYREYKLAAYPGASGFSALRREYESPLWLLLAISGVVLLIACANLANLMLARATTREREIAVRLALGAARGRLIRQLLTESLLLAAGGAALGALLATNLSGVLVRLLSSGDDRVFLDRALDWRVLGFTALLAGLTCVLFGLVPAFRATHSDPARVMNSAGRGMTTSRERFSVRRILAVCQVALSLVLLVGALLFVRTLRNLLTLDAGFQRTGLLVVDVDFSPMNVPVAQRV
jgi:putative ABC transport system permease protein